MNEPRGTGTTSRQMLDAPPNSVYIWCNTGLHYPMKLALHLGRPDLTIVSPSERTGPHRAIDPRRYTVIDHALDLGEVGEKLIAESNRQHKASKFR